jgi:tetratricopeptide (TPR) repeat protein
MVTNVAVAWIPNTVTTTKSTASSSTCQQTFRLTAIRGNDGEHDIGDNSQRITTQGPSMPTSGRRQLLQEWTAGVVAAATSTAATFVLPAFATDDEAVLVAAVLAPVELTPISPDARKFFNEGRALESQGNMAAAQRLYNKVTKISPRFVYGWSNLGNTQVAIGDLLEADNNYSKAIELCKESSADATAQGFGVKKCTDLYILLLNRGSVRLNTPGRKEDALADLRQANNLRDRPDAVVLQNLARAEEMNGYYSMADKNYNLAISMTANEVNPFWLRSAMVKLQVGDLKGGRDLLKRVEIRFPDAPEVKAASATFLWAMQKQQQPQQSPATAALLTTSTSTSTTTTTTADAAAPKPEINYQIDAQRKFLEIPDRQRLKFIDPKYLEETVAWPPLMIEGVTSIARVVGDYKKLDSPSTSE